MGAKAIILANPYTYKFLKGLTHSALVGQSVGRSLTGSKKSRILLLDKSGLVENVCSPWLDGWVVVLIYWIP